MKNIHILPTDKPSRLYKIRLTQNLQLLEKTYLTSSDSLVITQNIYITSAEDIKENDYIITLNKKVIQVSHILSEDVANGKKIIRTTDQDLIEDGVQAIDDEFLEWFVKNPSCEEFEVRIFIDAFEWRIIYKTIIPKEEHKQGTMSEAIKQVISNQLKQETLEEVAERFTEEWFKNNNYAKELFIKGAKWQQEQDKNKYSIDDLKESFAMGRTSATIKDFNTKFKNK
jgi:hypothetical protein